MPSPAKTLTVTIRGSADEITRLLASLELQTSEPSPPNEGGSQQTPAVAVTVTGPARCRAIKKDGVRCKLTASRVVFEGGLCPYHRDWPRLGRETLQE
jgi:hypothetical protein